MQYDPIKDRLGHFFCRHLYLQRVFYFLLDLFFLRSWYVKREIKMLLETQRPDNTINVLDAGTGFGQYTYFLAKTYPNVHILAIDIKQDYLDNIRLFVDQTSHAHQVELTCQDLTKLEVDGPFDFILSVDVMEHIEDDRAVFSHFARTLKSGGFVLINTPSDQGGSDVHEKNDPGFISEHVRDGYSLDELKEKLLDVGLKPVKSLYTYGLYGSIAWRMLIKWPMQILARHKVFLILLPFYYLVVLPVGLILNMLDLHRENNVGTGLIVIATK